MIYAGIGSRETPKEIRTYMRYLGKVLATNGCTLRTGGADSADRAFIMGAMRARKKNLIDIFLPVPTYRGWRTTNLLTCYSDITLDDLDMAAKYHPAWNRCRPFVRKLHARSNKIVLGNHLDRPVDFIICWTPNGTRSGGTGQALRIAEDKNIPIFDLAITDGQEFIDNISSILQTETSENERTKQLRGIV